MKTIDGNGQIPVVDDSGFPLDSQLGADLAALVTEIGSQLTRAEAITGHKSPQSERASFRLGFSDGRTLKGRRVESAAQAGRVMQLSGRLTGLPFARVLAQRGEALLEEWIDGVPLAGHPIAPERYGQAGELLGRLSHIAAGQSPAAGIPHGPDSKLNKLTVNLGELRAAGLITRDIAGTLVNLAMGNAPDSLDIGIVHHDFHPPNLLYGDQGLWAIDPELLETDALDADLARSFYLWSMTDPARQRFLQGYQRHRSTITFIQHELFWAIITIAAGARYWHHAKQLDERLIDALKVLASGRLPSPWLRDQVQRPGPVPNPGPVRSNHRIRVAVVCDYLALGGQERVILNLLKGLDCSRFEPYAYAFRGGEMAAAIEAEGVPLTLGSLKDPLSWRDWSEEDDREEAQWRIHLADALRRDRIDAVFIFAWKHGIEAAREAGVPALIERLDGPGLLAKVPDKSAFDKLICESATIRATLLERAAELGLDAERIELIYSGIDLERFDPERYDKAAMRHELGLREDEVAIGTVGRLTQGKNIELLMQAVSRLRPESLPQPIRLVIIGPDGGALASLQQLRSEHKLLRERVLFLEPRENVAPILAALDIFAMTSRSEGVPNALLEAMAMGLPIVATRVGSIHEVVYRNGVLADAAEPAVVASCLYRLIKHRDQRERMARNSRSVARRFGLRATMGRYEDLIVDILRHTTCPSQRLTDASSFRDSR